MPMLMVSRLSLPSQGNMPRIYELSSPSGSGTNAAFPASSASTSMRPAVRFSLPGSHSVPIRRQSMPGSPSSSYSASQVWMCWKTVHPGNQSWEEQPPFNQPLNNLDQLPYFRTSSQGGPESSAPSGSTSAENSQSGSPIVGGGGSSTSGGGGRDLFRRASLREGIKADIMRPSNLRHGSMVRGSSTDRLTNQATK